MGRRMRRGEIRWYRFQASDKKRPVLIVHRDDIIEHLSEITIAPLNTTIRDIPSEVFLSSTEDGVPRDCVVNVDNLQTVAKARIGPLVTTLSKAKMTSVGHAISFALGLV
jgi:mRNA interferase MazF